MKRLLTAAFFFCALALPARADLSPSQVERFMINALKGDLAARATLQAEVLRLQGRSASGYLEPEGGRRLYRLHQFLKRLPALPKVPVATPPSPRPIRGAPPEVPSKVEPIGDRLIVRKITFIAYRTDHETLKKHLPIEIGDIITPELLHEGRESLLRMQMFRSVAVLAFPMEGGGSEVRVEVKDGWYIIPFPFFFGGSGGSRGGMFFTARNVLRRAEAFSIVALIGIESTHTSFSAEYEGWALNASYEKRDFTERTYTDGGFSSSAGLGKAPDAEDPNQFGEVKDIYAKDYREFEVSLELPLLRDKDYMTWLSAEIGYEESIVRYSTVQGNNPGDAGTQNQYIVRLKAFSQSNVGSELGQLLGYGLADLEAKIRPLRRARFQSPMEATGYLDTRFSKKSFRYRKLVLRWDPSVTWGSHNVVAAYFVGARGVNIQPYRLPDTGLGLQGSYAREYRGLAVLGMGVRLSKPMFASKLGVLRLSGFAEKGRAFNRGLHQDQAGFGGSFYYIFWRVPIPLGLTYTYSLNDRSTQITAAVGGAF